jgi:maltooligosyltrehalose trehalohydrolase
VEALTAILLLSPQIPLLFMGEEWGETGTFTFFTDFHGELGDLVREGRRNEFRRWPGFHDPRTRDHIPDPNAESSFLAAKLDWKALHRPSRHARHEFVRRLLDVRRREIAPRLKGMAGGGLYEALDGGAFVVRWRLGDGSTLSLYANIDDEPWPIRAAYEDRFLFESAGGLDARLKAGDLPGWSALFYLNETRRLEATHA